MILKVSSFFMNLSEKFSFLFAVMSFNSFNQFDTQYASLATSSQPLMKTIVCIPSNLQNHISNIIFNGSSKYVTTRSTLSTGKWPSVSSDK